MPNKTKRFSEDRSLSSGAARISNGLLQLSENVFMQITPLKCGKVQEMVFFYIEVYILGSSQNVLKKKRNLEKFLFCICDNGAPSAAIVSSSNRRLTHSGFEKNIFIMLIKN